MLRIISPRARYRIKKIFTLSIVVCETGKWKWSQQSYELKIYQTLAGKISGKLLIGKSHATLSLSRWCNFFHSCLFLAQSFMSSSNPVRSISSMYPMLRTYLKKEKHKISIKNYFIILLSGGGTIVKKIYRHKRLFQFGTVIRSGTLVIST
jgi:hypothetical protein